MQLFLEQRRAFSFHWLWQLEVMTAVEWERMLAEMGRDQEKKILFGDRGT